MSVHNFTETLLYSIKSLNDLKEFKFTEPGSYRAETLGINLKKPKFPLYATVSKRLESFKTWPEYVQMHPEMLAECGLVYTGKGDSCRCYHCGGGLRNWETGDDPWKEHAKWFPGCGHVFLAKGKEFIAEVRGITDYPSANDQSTLAHKPQSQQDDSDNVYDPMDSVPALSCLQMGCARNLVEMAIQRYVRDHGNSAYSATDLMRIVLSMEDGIETGVTPRPFPEPQSIPFPEPQSIPFPEPQSIPFEEPNTTETFSNPAPEEAVSDMSPEETQEKVKAENDQLKQRQICKICLDAKASVIFLPCGHMVSCPLCAPALVKCPICRVYIRGTVKAYLTGVN